MLTWLGDIITALLEFVPRRVIIPATHRGVKWGLRGSPVEMKPGWRWYWPLISMTEVIPVARQTITTEVQALTTRDNKQVVVGAVIVYSIKDVVKAIGERNYDLDDTVHDVSQTAIVEIITKWDFCKLLESINDQVMEDLTDKCRKRLRCFGVYVHRAAVTNFSGCKSVNLLGVNLSAGE